MEGEVLKFDELDMGAFNTISNPEEDQEIEKINNEVSDQEEVSVPKVEKPKKEEKPEEEVAEEDKEIEEDNSDPESSDDDGDSSPSLYSSLAKVLAEEGLLPSFNEEDQKLETKEDFIEAFRKEIKNSEYAGLNETQRKYLEGLGNGIPEDDVRQQITIESQLNNITEDEIKSNQELRKQIILNDFILKGYNKEKAEKLTQRSFDIGEDESDALEAMNDVKGFYQKEYDRKVKEAQDAKKQAEEQSAKQLEDLRKTITEFKEVIPGVKVSEKDKTKIYEMATKPVAQLQNGTYINALMKAKIEDPVNFEAKLNYLFYITKEFKDFDIIKKTQKSKATKELSDFVKGNTFTPSGSSSTDNLDFDPYKSGFSSDVINNIK